MLYLQQCDGNLRWSKSVTVVNRTLIFLETHYYEFHTIWTAIKNYLMGHEKICFWIAKFMSNKYLVKSLQRYAKAQEFYEVVKIGQWLIQHWFHNKVIFVTLGNDSLQICQLGCAVSNNYHCEYSSTSHPMCCEFNWIGNEKCKSNTYLLANYN